MIAESPAKDMTKETEGNSARGLRAHVLGLIGANLVVGSLFLWALAMLARLWHQSAPGILQHLLPPWTATGGVVALIYGAVALAAMIFGVVLVARAARMLRVRGED